MLVTLPFALLLLDGWPLGRALRPGERRSPPAGLSATCAPGGRWSSKSAPFFALSLLSSLVTLRGADAQRDAVRHPRLRDAARQRGRLLRALPRGLRLARRAGVPLPLPPRGNLPAAAGAAAAAGIVLVSAAVLSFGRRRPYLPFGWLWYLGTLVPVIGLMQVGGQARSDRYTYLTMIGVAVALIWLAGDLWPRRTGARRALTGAFVVAARGAGRLVRGVRARLAGQPHPVRATRCG